jgi:beta-lactamase superfamily II metal-dependent hydrolase
MESLTVNGEILNVGDGDTILLILRKGKKTFFIVVDGGDTSSEDYVLDRVIEKCSELRKKGPDLVICTHYDSDHIAGLIKIVNYFGNKIGEIWMHRLPMHIQVEHHLIVECLEHHLQSHLLSEAAKPIANIRIAFPDPNERLKVLLESIRQAHDLLTIVFQNGISLREPFANECPLSEWPEITILGPTRAYFQGLFPNQRLDSFTSSEYHFYLQEVQQRKKQDVKDPCSLLKTQPTTSAINRASVIFRIDVRDQGLLFTGDAGVESFENIVNYPTSIKNMTFLKIPHHGSNNNINRKLIDLINPLFAYNSGNVYETPEVMACLKATAGREVKSTKDGQDLLFQF